MNDYTKMGHKMGSYCGADAMRWAEAFCQIMRETNFDIDEGLMVGWFANAIEQAEMARHPEPIGAGIRCAECNFTHGYHDSKCSHLIDRDDVGVSRDDRPES